MNDNNQSDSKSKELVRPKKKFKADKSSKRLSFHEIVANNDVKQLSYLLDLHKSQGAGVDLNQRYEEKKTPLHKAAIYNKKQSHFELIEILLNNGADINARDDYGHTSLWYLVQNPCNLEMLKLFLRFNPDLTNADGFESSILIAAVNKSDNVDIVKFLIEDVGLDVNHRNMSGATPLQFSAAFNLNDSHYEVLKYLLKIGANVNARENGGRTPIWELVRDSNLKVFDLFLKHNADLHSVTNSGKNILFAFDDKNSDVQVLEKLISDFSLDVKHTDKTKQTPLHYILDCYSIEQINIKVIKCLLKNGADINAYDEHGFTPLINTVIRINFKYKEEWFLENMDFFNFLIDQTDFSVVHNNVHIFEYYENYYDDDDQPHSKYIWKWILGHLAKLKFLSIPIHSLILKFIQDHTVYKDYFEKCTEELGHISITNPQKSWINFFNLLVDDRRKLKNFAANEDLIEDYEKNDWLKVFPIYGAAMQKNVKKGMNRRKLFDESAILLSDYLPIFNSNHLIVKDILDCILSKKDLSKFCE